MKLSDASQAFDDEAFADSYYPSVISFYGQTDVYDGSKRDGSTVVRRILSVAPGVTIPTRGAIKSGAGDLDYIVGLKIYDSFRGTSVREKYIIQRSNHLAAILSTLDVLNGATGTEARAGTLWLKNAKDERVGSESHPVYNIYFSSYETVIKGQVIEVDGVLYRVKVVSRPASGFKIAECFEFAEVLSTITYTPSATAKDVASDSYLPQTPADIPGLRERFLSYYENEDAGRVKFVTGDELLSIRKSDVAAPVLQDYVTLGTEDWTIMDIRDPGDDTWGLHVRRR